MGKCTSFMKKRKKEKHLLMSVVNKPGEFQGLLIHHFLNCFYFFPPVVTFSDNVKQQLIHRARWGRAQPHISAFQQMLIRAFG